MNREEWMEALYGPNWRVERGGYPDKSKPEEPQPAPEESPQNSSFDDEEVQED